MFHIIQVNLRLPNRYDLDRMSRMSHTYKAQGCVMTPLHISGQLLLGKCQVTSQVAAPGFLPAMISNGAQVPSQGMCAYVYLIRNEYPNFVPCPVQLLIVCSSQISVFQYLHVIAVSAALQLVHGTQ